jgi:hypothetical protein
MIKLELNEQQVMNIKMCILRTSKLPEVDENGMIALLGLSRLIDEQVAHQKNGGVKVVGEEK